MSTMATPAKTVRVGVITGSTRVVRAGPQVAAFVRSLIEKDLETSALPLPFKVEIEDVDIAALSLPIFDEPGIPAYIEVPDGYAHEHTRAWSRRVSALDAFVFVTPQYNYSVPAGLKNAIDYLSKEWQGKPFVVVSYGGHGGTNAAEALQSILKNGLRMRAAPTTVNLTFPDMEVMGRATKGEDLGLAAGGESTVWADRGGDIVQLWRKLAEMVTTPAEEK
ncbi:MAG: hypothetical protein STHCBS139747_005763 [Sporothrix thermara]